MSRKSNNEPIESSLTNYRSKERTVLAIIGLSTIFIYSLGVGWVALPMLIWSLVVLTRDWNIFEKIIWVTLITGLFVF